MRVYYYLIVIFILFACKNSVSEQKHEPMVSSKIEGPTDTATFGTGCFWCTEAQFELLNGVIKVSSGYSGGKSANPSYEEVSSGKSGHAEVVQIIYDPAAISYDELLEAFWASHDPTQLNRQGNDIGPQYRSVIFYHNDEQKEKAVKYKNLLNESNAYDKEVVTEISPFRGFYIAEDYHQDYFKLNRQAPYCQFVVAPKVEKFKEIFRDKMK